MGRVSKAQAAEVAAIANKLAAIYEEGGTDADLQAALVPWLEEVVGRIHTGRLNASTALKGLLPALWREVGAAIDTSASSARLRLLSYDISTRGPLAVGEEIKALRDSDSAGYEKVLEAKLTSKVPFNSEIWENLRDLFDKWLTETSDEESDSERIARLILAIGFFTGRRPWSEVALTAKFAITTSPVRRDWRVSLKTDPNYLSDFELIETPIEDPSWPEGWIRFDGNAKRTRKEDVAGFSIPLDLPILGIDPETVISGLSELRELELTKCWYRPKSLPKDSIIEGAVGSYAAKQIRAYVDPIVDPIYSAGYRFPDSEKGRFMTYHLRPLYAARIGVAMREATGKNTDQIVITKHLLGHFGGLGKASLAYQSLAWIGDRAIPLP